MVHRVAVLGNLETSVRAVDNSSSAGLYKSRFQSKIGFLVHLQSNWTYNTFPGIGASSPDLGRKIKEAVCCKSIQAATV